MSRLVGACCASARRMCVLLLAALTFLQGGYGLTPIPPGDGGRAKVGVRTESSQVVQTTLENLSPCPAPHHPLLATLRKGLALQKVTTQDQCLHILPVWLGLSPKVHPPLESQPLAKNPQATRQPDIAAGATSPSCAFSDSEKLRKRAHRLLTCIGEQVMKPLCGTRPDGNPLASSAPTTTMAVDEGSQRPPQDDVRSVMCARAGMAMKQVETGLVSANRMCCFGGGPTESSLQQCGEGILRLSAAVSALSAAIGLNGTLSNGSTAAAAATPREASEPQCVTQVSSFVRLLRRVHGQLQFAATFPSLISGLGNSTTRLATILEDMIKSTASLDSDLAPAVEQEGSQSTTDANMVSFLRLLSFLTCDSLFPMCSRTAADSPLTRVQPCAQQCFPIASLLTSLKPFVDTAKVPELQYLSVITSDCGVTSREQQPPVCMVMSCGANGGGKVQGSTPCKSLAVPSLVLEMAKGAGEEAAASRAQPQGFCMNLECHAPLKATTEKSHWDRRIAGSLEKTHHLLGSYFPEAKLPFNDSLLACGQACTTVGFSSQQQKVARYILSLGSIGTEIFTIVALLAFWFNRATLGKVLVRRLVLYFNISSAVTVSVFVPVAFADVESFVCHEDGTRRLKEPSSSALCVLTESLAHLGISMTGLLFLSFTHAWFDLIRSLNTPGTSARAHKMTARAGLGGGLRDSPYLMDAMYIGGSLLISLIFVLIVLVRRGIEGSPLYGICMARQDGFFLEFVIAPLAVSLGIGSVFLVFGLYHLAQHRKKEQERHMRRQAEAVAASNTADEKASKGHTVISWSSSGMPSRTKRHTSGSTSSSTAGSSTRAAFRRLIHQMLFYIFVVFVNIVAMLVLGAYIGLHQGDWTKQTTAHLECRMSSCDPDQCPPLPDLSLGFFLAPFAIGFFSSMILCSWAFSWKLWSGVFGRSSAEPRSDGIFASSKFDASRTQVAEPVVRPDLCRQDTHEVKIPYSPRRSAVSGDFDVGTGSSSPPSYSSSSPVSCNTATRIIKNTTL
ncbi:uncharacterized protein LOC135813972 [Sycon ciliatum]|uniref:uncharacterized protein LOC135813972 n=1 Tax=Sycon ciliatum TaxID=27933 RepID=UPI0031F677AF